MGEHATTPYKVVFEDGFGDLAIASEDRPGLVIAKILRDLDGKGEVNAEFIVRACNSHEELLKVAKAYESWEAMLIVYDTAWRDPNGEPRDLPRIPQTLWDQLIEIQNMRNAAIVRAEGSS